MGPHKHQAKIPKVDCFGRGTWPAPASKTLDSIRQGALDSPIKRGEPGIGFSIEKKPGIGNMGVHHPNKCSVLCAEQAKVSRTPRNLLNFFGHGELRRRKPENFKAWLRRTVMHSDGTKLDAALPRQLVQVVS